MTGEAAVHERCSSVFPARLVAATASERKGQAAFVSRKPSRNLTIVHLFDLSTRSAKIADAYDPKERGTDHG
jgi:hypothetical protein